MDDENHDADQSDDSEAESEQFEDSDEELQAAFESGLLTPGTTYREVVEPKKFINNKAALKEKVEEIYLSTDWAERLDVTTERVFPSDIEELDESKSKMSVHNDFLREMSFYNQALAACQEALPRLKELGIPTDRPADYYAEMLKPDHQMKKIREKLLEKKAAAEKTEKIRRLREQRKYGKQVQIAAIQQKQKEKRQTLDAIKQFRQRRKNDKESAELSADLSFLTDSEAPGRGKQTGKKKGSATKKVSKKRKWRDEKYGFGGQKKRKKNNTASTAAELPFNRRKHGAPAGKFSHKRSKKQRPGKKARDKLKARRKKS